MTCGWGRANLKLIVIVSKRKGEPSGSPDSKQIMDEFEADQKLKAAFRREQLLFAALTFFVFFFPLSNIEDWNLNMVWGTIYWVVTLVLAFIWGKSYARKPS